MKEGRKAYRILIVTALLVGTGVWQTSLAAVAFDRRPGYVKEGMQQAETLEFDGQKFVQMRTVIDIPKEFGKLINITTGGLGAVFWFEDEKGLLRNVTLEVTEPILIQRKEMAQINTHGL